MSILGLIIPILLAVAAIVAPWCVAWASKYHETKQIPDSKRAWMARVRKAKLIPAVPKWFLLSLSFGFAISIQMLLHSGKLLRHSPFLILSVLVLGNADDLILYLLFRHRIRAFLNKVLQEDSRVCLECHYMLRGHGDSGRCPECGTEFKHADLVQAWQNVKYAHYALV